MKLEAITLREIRVPLKHFYETSFGRTEIRRVLLVTIRSEGVEGWAECVAGEGPFFRSEWMETAWATARAHLAPLLVGREVDEAKQVPALLSRVRGHNMAKAVLENADIVCHAKLPARTGNRRLLRRIHSPCARRSHGDRARRMSNHQH